MSISVSTKYPGDLRVACTYLQSGATVITDGPTDIQGKGEFFSPMDLCAAALAACTLTTIGVYGKNHKVNVDGMEATVAKVVGANPRLIQRIEVVITMPDRAYSEKEKASIENAARSCPVRASLNADMEKILEFKWAR